VSGQDFGLYAPRDIPQFLGMAWVDAMPADFPEVRAYIGGVDCTGTPGIMPTDMDSAAYSVTVFSEGLKPGCGEPGDTVTFTINDRTANETATWQPVLEGEAPVQAGRGQFDLTAGAPFAALYVSVEDVLSGGEIWPVHALTVALIGDRVCGVGLHRVWGAILLPVPSAEQTPGCGEPGAQIRFAVNGFAIPETRAWKPGRGEQLKVRLEASPDTPTAGPAFAYYTFALPARPEDYVGQPEQSVEAFVGGVSCGHARGLGPEAIVLAVAPAELARGCGREGAAVSFRVDGAVVGTAAWEPGFQAGPALGGAAGAEAAPAPTTVTDAQAGGSRISPPDTGDGGLPR
jgi:hypothetical protein